MNPAQNLQAESAIQPSDDYVTLAINSFQTNLGLDATVLKRVGEGDYNSFSYSLAALRQITNDPDIETSITNKALTLQILDGIKRMSVRIIYNDPNQANKLYKLYTLACHGLYNDGEGFTYENGWSDEAFRYRDRELNMRLAGIQDQGMRDKITVEYYYNYTVHQELNRLSRRSKDKPNSEAKEVDNIFPKLGRNVRENMTHLLLGYKLCSPEALSLVLDSQNRMDPELAKYHLIADLISRIELLKNNRSDIKEVLSYLITVHDLIDSGELRVDSNGEFKKVNDNFFKYPLGQRFRIVQGSIQTVLKKYGIDAFSREEVAERKEIGKYILYSYDLYDPRIDRQEPVVKFEDLDKYKKKENALMRKLYANRILSNVQGFGRCSKILRKILEKYDKLSQAIKSDHVDLGPLAGVPLVGGILAVIFQPDELTVVQKELNKGSNSLINPHLVLLARLVNKELGLPTPEDIVRQLSEIEQEERARNLRIKFP